MDDSSNIINKQYINIGTQNVKGFNNIEKRNYFFTLYNEELNLDIIGLTETKTKKNEDKFIGKPNKLDNKEYLNDYQTWWSGSDKHFMGAGVGLAIKKNLAQHVYNIEKLEGRAIKAELQFKGHIKFKIINTYIHASENDATSRSNLIQKIKAWIKKGQQQNDYIIIIGDMNADPDKYEEKFVLQQKKIKPKYEIIQMLNNINLLDLHKITSVNSTPEKTWKQYKSNSSDQNKLIASRLDQIWITNNLLYRAIKCEVINDELSNTDHSLLIGTIEVTNLLDKHNIATERKIKFKRKIFDYKNMQEQDWTNFQQYMDKYIQDRKVRQRYFNKLPRDTKWIDNL